MLLKRIFKVNRTTAMVNRMFCAKHEDSPAIIQSAQDRLKFYKPNKHYYDDQHNVITVKEIQEGIKKNNPFDDPEIDRIINLKPGDAERNKFYHGISEVKGGDHQVIKKVKKSIRKLIDQEIEFLKFQDQLKAEERESLLSEAASEVETRKSFYYKYDSKKVYDIHAPGNIFKKQSIALPHEHIHPQHHIDAKSLTDSDLQEMYGLYTYLIDLHISQVRRDVKDKNYIPPQFNQISITEPNFHEHTIDNKFFEFYHRWREPTRTWKSQTQEIDYQKELDALPVNHHPDHRATTHNDVEWRSEQKFPHVANRKGYPILAESPLEKITGIERAPAHPSYQVQAFVQTPSMDPDPTLNFEKAEVVYENYRIGEWIRMWRWTAGIILPFWPAFFTFEIYQADGPPSLQWLADYGFNHQIPLQFQDSGDYNLKKMRYVDEHDYMSLAYIFKRMMLRPTHTFYQLIVLALLQNLSFNYVTKMVYNKDRDLVFVYKPDGIFSDKEYIYEVHHLESMVPPVTAYPHIGAGHKDGILLLNCMDTREQIRLYNDPKYWNLELRDDFLSQTRSMWNNLSNKYEGRVITLGNIADEKQQAMMRRIERELDEAVEKHGEVTPTVPYHVQKEDELFKSRKRIAESVL